MTISKRLEKFHKELNLLCKPLNRSKPEIIYSTKYLTLKPLAAFITNARVYHSEVWIGENRVQSAIEKQTLLSQPSVKPIMIGTLQRNKIGKALELFDEIHSVDSIPLIWGLERHLSTGERVLPIFLEVNVTGESNKHGIRPDALDKVVNEVEDCSHLNLIGLMTMAPLLQDEAIIRKTFRELRSLAANHGLLTSMGMSQDWKIAVEEGSDVLRIGSLLFKKE